MTTKADRIEEAKRLIKTIERDSSYRLSALVDDGSAFLVAVAKDGTPYGPPFPVTLTKLRRLAALGPAPKL